MTSDWTGETGLPSFAGPHPISGVPTSIAAFVGRTLKGLSHQARPVSKFSEFERDFGGLAEECPVSHSVRHFFRNGGTDAFVVRVARADGAPPRAADYSGDPENRTGLHALEGADLFNILCLPGVEDARVISEALAYVAARRAFFILDLPGAIDTPVKAQGWLAANPLLRSRDAAAWFPRFRATDPISGAVRDFPSSGAVAGIFARSDAARGVWKSPPAGEAGILDAIGVAISLGEADARALQSGGLNTVRSFPSKGTVLWGARTLHGSDQNPDEYKYVPVRRLALFLEESIFRGTSWAVFEPNDEPLWKKMRASVDAFLRGLFLKGAFQGTTPREAYFVRCGRDTMSRNDIDNGRLIIEIGIAPVRPAEFVIIRIGQFGCRP